MLFLIVCFWNEGIVCFYFDLGIYEINVEVNYNSILFVYVFDVNELIEYFDILNNVKEGIVWYRGKFRE